MFDIVKHGLAGGRGSTGESTKDVETARFIRAAHRTAHQPNGAWQALEPMHAVRQAHPSARSQDRRSQRSRGGRLIDGRVERHKLSPRQQIQSLTAGHRRPGGGAQISPPNVLASGHRSLLLPDSSPDDRHRSRSPFEWRRQRPTIPAQHTRRRRRAKPAASYYVWPFDGNQLLRRRQRGNRIISATIPAQNARRAAVSRSLLSSTTANSATPNRPTKRSAPAPSSAALASVPTGRCRLRT
jgi:hypothetical protein